MFTKLLLMDKRNAFPWPLESGKCAFRKDVVPAFQSRSRRSKRRYSVYSIKGDFRRRTRNSVDASCQKADPWTCKLFILNFHPSSQAERRGFDPRLPLHRINNLGMFHVLRFNAINALSSRSPRGARLEGAAKPSNQFQNHSRSLLFQRASSCCSLRRY